MNVVILFSALTEVYSQDLECRFPLYKSSEVKDSTIIIHFEHVGEGLTSIDGEPLKEFTICGQDQYFIPAVGEIVGNTVVVSNSKVNAPAAVRYG